MDQDKKERIFLYIREGLIILATGLLAFALIFNAVNSCSVEQAPKPVSSAGQCVGGLGVGQTLEIPCPKGELGQTVKICKSAGAEPEILSNSCSTECNQVTFEEIKPILVAGKCANCHAVNPTEYDVAKAWAPKIINRINLSPGTQYFMPKGGQPLPSESRLLIEKWQSDGLIKDKTECIRQGGSKVTWYDIEKIAQRDLDRVTSTDKINTRWCQASHLVRTEADMLAIKRALDKTLTSVDNRNVKVVLSTVVDANIGLFRFDLSSYDLSREDWQDFENVEPFGFDSLTDTGKVLQLLTASRKPIVHCDNLIDIVTSNSNLYYDWLNVPHTFNELMQQQGVDYAADIRNFKASFLGFNGSVIANNKNRLLIRHEAKLTGSYMWNTQDTRALNNIRERNLFFAPLTRETGSNRVFDYAAGESIWGLPSGAQAYALHDKFGILQAEAPTEVVTDDRSSIFPRGIISTAATCMNCHSAGIIVAEDQLRNFALGGNPFGSEDKRKVLGLYKSKAANDANFLNDNTRFQAYLTKVGISPADPDPIYGARQYLRSDWSASKAAGYMGLDLDTFLKLLRNSRNSPDEVGQLLTGGTATYDVMMTIMERLVDELDILEEKINGE